MTSGGEAAQTQADAEGGEADELKTADAAAPAPPLLDAAGWRTVFRGLPTGALWRVLQKEKVSEARIFAGFRPAPQMLRSHPVVLTRLVDEAVKFPAFAKAVREILPTPAEANDAAESAAPAAVNDAPLKKPPKTAQLPPEPKLEGDEKAKEQLKALRGTVRENAARIKALETQIAEIEP